MKKLFIQKFEWINQSLKFELHPILKAKEGQEHPSNLMLTIFATKRNAFTLKMSWRVSNYRIHHIPSVQAIDAFPSPFVNF